MRIDRARGTDRASLGAIARRSHRDSRFYADPNFPRGRCDDLYERWIANACDGDADAVWVARLGDDAVGYLSGHLDPGGVGRIGLVGVAERARGQSLGSGLVGTALAHFAREGALEARVVTQRRNAGAQALYERAGFRVESIRPWLHGWFTGASARVGGLA